MQSFVMSIKLKSSTWPKVYYILDTMDPHIIFIASEQLVFKN